MGGMAVLGALIYYVCDFPVGYTVFIINAVLLLIALKSVNKTLVVRTVVATIVMSSMISFMQPIFVQPIVAAQPFMNTIIGSLICGIGIGMVFVYNGSTGGTDIIAAIVNLNRSISVVRAMLYCDLLIISSSSLLFHNIDQVVFGLVALVFISHFA